MQDTFWEKVSEMAINPQKTKIPIQHLNRGNQLIFEVSHLKEVVIDSGKDLNAANLALAFYNLLYVWFLKHLAQCCERLPLYTISPFERGLTPFTPPTPPLTLLSLNESIFNEAEALTEQLSQCVALHPFKEYDLHKHLRDKPDVKDYTVFYSGMSSTDLDERVARALKYIINNGYSFKNELWLEKHGVLQPITLRTHLRELIEAEYFDKGVFCLYDEHKDKIKILFEDE